MSIQKPTSQLTETLSISSITIDHGIFPRSQFNESVLSEYSEAIHRGAQFPPVTVFYDGCEYWLADSFHQVLAMEVVGRMEIQAAVLFGCRRDAVLFAVRANSKHGL